MDELDATTTEDALRDSFLTEPHWKAILAGMLDPVLTIDKFGTILYANTSCEATFGYTTNELVGSNIKFLMPEPYQSEHDGYLAHYRKTGETGILGRTREFPVLTKAGDEIRCELSVSRIEVPGRAEAVYCGSFRDVTARRAAERALAESERRFRAIFDQEYQFVGLLDPQGTLLEANRASLEAVGAKLAEVIGKPFWDTPWWSHSTEAQEQVKRAVRDAAAGSFVRFETTHPLPRGGLLSVDFSLKPFRNDQGEIVLLLPEGRDITVVKRAQQRELALMRAFAEIGESASLLAHEIKNPITAVNTALRAVAKQLGEEDQVVLGDLVERMKKLESLMRRTLSLARPLELHLAPCDAGELLSAAARLLQPHLDAAQVLLEVEVAPDCARFEGDAQLLEEVLTNLIRNAVDALGSGGRIGLSAEADPGGVRLRVEDDGPGIPESLLATLFKPFVSTKANGTGLGLAIARKIVEAHGGTIEVHNSPLGGARFEICLPLSA